MPGGAGTASEAALALHYQRPIVAFMGRDEMSNLPIGVPATTDLDVLHHFICGHLGEV